MDIQKVCESIAVFLKTELLHDESLNIGFDESLTSEWFIDSFGLNQLGTFLETKFGVMIDTEDLADLAADEKDSIAEIAQLIVRQVA